MSADQTGRQGSRLWSRNVLPINLFHILEYTRFRSYVPEPDAPMDSDLDVLAAVIAHSLSRVISKGLVRDYTDYREITSHPHGHIDVRTSVSTCAVGRRKLCCDYQFYDEMTFCNSFIASAADALLTSGLNGEVHRKLAEVSRPLEGIPRIALSRSNADTAVYSGRDRDYADLLEFCRLFVYDMLPSSVSRGGKVNRFISDERFFSIFEDFLRGYYSAEHPEIYDSAKEIGWSTVEWVSSDSVRRSLPAMWTDARLSSAGSTLIMDAKCYSEPMSTGVQGAVPKYDSGNMYQMLAYAENLKIARHCSGDRVATMLVYAVLDGSFEGKGGSYEIGGTMHHVVFLNLSDDWRRVRSELDSIAGGVKDGTLFVHP